MTAFLALAALWVAVGTVNAGFAYAHLQRKYACIADKTREDDKQFCVMVIALGPCGVVASLVLGWFGHGWLFPWGKP
ncbi:hypothetical protein EN866_35145 [Mesorhizobium sp. M2D.F.Ca.ET.223.01.1.1]|uniref:hypothetical protein n=1 Tax=Mesorhizobium sp. M2D.F.Ca.ET.223.01.1.1 TaxID=2563940 RepID=UPI00109303E4|nr:hypothetical protein [Mesorhizobium sp. M2D.F.Ca.ET.223.01.1.1]TGR81830.1 hypothetical protein EN866_35145 [Mesorhizobium sp. M2D.F.Ca.ET.223.01.1.1]TGT64476.1 hypothetical protein EN802_32325 [bacterium M00.F.Ca.ET.159.01.1.1]TGT79321.1 hypothetical protein EN800_31665 [bacterium M00.F.Ca.ET.157.01.1.1]